MRGLQTLPRIMNNKNSYFSNLEKYCFRRQKESSHTGQNDDAPWWRLNKVLPKESQPATKIKALDISQQDSCSSKLSRSQTSLFALYFWCFC